MQALKKTISIQSNGTVQSTDITDEHFQRLRRIAFWSCILSFAVDIILGTTALVNCIRTKSFVGFSYSVHTFMDCLCTSFVSWHLNGKTIDAVRHRDPLACCIIGALFVGSFLAIETRAIQSLISPPSVRPDLTVVMYSYVHIIVFTILSIIKMRISRQIQSVALKFDTINSFIGIIMVLPLIVWNRVVFINKFTYLDDLVQVLMALFLFLAGGKLILDSITLMNTEYARKLHDERVKRMLDDTDDGLVNIIQSHFVVGT